MTAFHRPLLCTEVTQLPDTEAPIDLAHNQVHPHYYLGTICCATSDIFVVIRLTWDDVASQNCSCYSKCIMISEEIK